MLGRSADELPGQMHLAQDLIEALPVPVFFKARDGRYLGVNRAWEEFFGVPRDEFLGKTVHELYPQSPGVAEKHLAMDVELWANPGSQRYEIPLKVGDGRVRHTIYYKATFCGADGEVEGPDRHHHRHHRAEAGRAARGDRARGGAPDARQTVAEAIRGIIEVMCERFGWACGARWSLDERQNRLHCVETWGSTIPRSALPRRDRGMIFAPGDAGMIRRTLTTRHAVWVADVARENRFHARGDSPPPRACTARSRCRS